MPYTTDMIFLSNEGVLNSIVPFFSIGLQKTIYDWNFTTTPQDGLNGRVLDYPRGHILGGTSSISKYHLLTFGASMLIFCRLSDAMFYTRGSSADFDRFANVTGDPGWSWNSLQPYIRKVRPKPYL